MGQIFQTPGTGGKKSVLEFLKNIFSFRFKTTPKNTWGSNISQMLWKMEELVPLVKYPSFKNNLNALPILDLKLHSNFPSFNHLKFVMQLLLILKISRNLHVNNNFYPFCFLEVIAEISNVMLIFNLKYTFNRKVQL